MKLAIVGLEHLACRSHGIVNHTDFAHRSSRPSCRIFQCLAERMRIERCVRAGIPLDLQLLPPLKSGPGTAGDDGQTPQRLKSWGSLVRGQLQDLLDTGHGEGLAVVVR